MDFRISSGAWGDLPMDRCFFPGVSYVARRNARSGDLAELQHHRCSCRPGKRSLQGDVLRQELERFARYHQLRQLRLTLLDSECHSAPHDRLYAVCEILTSLA